MNELRAPKVYPVNTSFWRAPPPCEMTVRSPGHAARKLLTAVTAPQTLTLRSSFVNKKLMNLIKNLT